VIPREPHRQIGLRHERLRDTHPFQRFFFDKHMRAFGDHRAHTLRLHRCRQ